MPSPPEGKELARNQASGGGKLSSGWHRSLRENRAKPGTPQCDRGLVPRSNSELA